MPIGFSTYESASKHIFFPVLVGAIVDVDLPSGRHGLGFASQLAQDVLQDAAVLVVEDLLRCVDAEGDREFDGFSLVILGEDGEGAAVRELDRKSTRLNSSHRCI